MFTTHFTTSQANVHYEVQYCTVQYVTQPIVYIHKVIKVFVRIV